MNESTLVPREEMSDLDWLARNVHKWPYERQNHCYVMTEYGARKNVSACATSPFFSKFTKDQWLYRRAELQNKPSWNDAPEWAKWLCQRDDGAWFWCGVKPSLKNDKWDVDGKSMSCYPAGDCCETNVLGDWRDTIEKRPCAHKPRQEMSQESIEEIKSVMPKNWAELESFVNADCQSKIPEHCNHPKPSTDIQECAEVKQFEPFVSVEDEEPEYSGAVDAAKEYLAKCAERAATAKQPAPKGSGNPILGMVLADLTNRALEGKEKYGEPLLAHNGRNPLWDAYQEALDLAMYLRQAIEEQKQC